MANSATPPPPSADGPGGPHAILTRYLAHRAPAALLVDAAALLVLAFVASHLWVAIADATSIEYRTKPADSLVAGITRPASIMQTVFSVLYHAAWILAGWAAVRQVASRIGPPAHEPGTPNESGTTE